MTAAIEAHIGARIRKARKAAGLSQEKLCVALGVTYQMVQKFEKGSLLSVLIDVVNRADLANETKKPRGSITARMRWEGGSAGTWKLLWASSDLDGDPRITDGVEFDFVATVDRAT